MFIFSTFKQQHFIVNSTHPDKQYHFDRGTMAIYYWSQDAECEP